MKDIFDYVLEEDLTEDLEIIHNICGLETVKKLLRNFQGLNFYIPRVCKLDKLVTRYLKEYRNKPVKLLASELKVSEAYVRNIRKREKVR